MECKNHINIVVTWEYGPACPLCMAHESENRLFAEAKTAEIARQQAVEELAVLQAFASAGVLAGARLAQHEGLVPGVFGGPPEDDFETWTKTLIDLMLPLGANGYLILYALTHLIEGAPDLLLYLTAAEINRSVVGAVPDARDGIVEYKGAGAEDGGHYPGTKGSGAEPLRALLDVTRRWSIRPEIDRCEE